MRTEDEPYCKPQHLQHILCIGIASASEDAASVIRTLPCTAVTGIWLDFWLTGNPKFILRTPTTVQYNIASQAKR